MIRVEALSHKYSSQWAIKDINFEIKNNGVLGLLGSNGAGKSTTMNIICGVLNQTEGNVFINDINIKKDPERAKQHIGFLPQQAPLHVDLTVDEYLTHSAILRRVEPKKVRRAVEEAKDTCGIAHFSNRLIRNLSGGYQQRVGIAQAIVHDPGFVVFDEPTNGLDPIQILEVRKLIQRISQEKAVLMSTHVLSEVQMTCSNIHMIEHGKLVFAGSIENFNNQITPETLIATFNIIPDNFSSLEQIRGVNRIEKMSSDVLKIFYDGSSDVSQNIVKHSVDKGWSLSEISVERNSLESIFAKLSNREI
ncbi:MAG: ABC transporter ATP-binding protein [Marinifilaceae bacterium]|jgi:ABC-2 type transport system ATP-binding protein|nr:ABC transporter ATP-binding protein [Marinifilaceae bacterium]